MDLSMLRSCAYLNLGDRRTVLSQFYRLHQTMASERTRADRRRLKAVDVMIWLAAMGGFDPRHHTEDLTAVAEI